MWISLIIAVLTYFMSDRGTSTERNQALLKAAGAGALAYGVTEYTDWGKKNLQPLDDRISGVFSSDKAEDIAAVNKNGEAIVKTGTTKSASSGVWDAIKSWGPTVATAVGGAAIASSLPWWAVPAGLAVGAYLLLKD